jgi:EmrB/QacA subfamily drug resistance transporter
MKFTRRQYTLAATALGSSLAFIDASAVIVALPTIQKALHLGLSGEQWVFLSYSLALAALYLIGGAVGDRKGHRKVFLWGVAGFAVASIFAGFSQSGWMLLSFRVLQGVAGAFLTTNSLAWLRSVYGDEAGKAVGLWTSLTGIATIAAPPLGGAITQYISWRWIFFINIPLALLVIWWGRRGEPDIPKLKEAPPLDFVGSVLIALGFGSLTYALVQDEQSGFAKFWWLLAVGIALLGLFVWNEARSKAPMLPLRFFKIRNFSLANLETLLMYGGLNIILVFLTLYLQFLGMSPLVSSLFLIPVSVVMILFAAVFGNLADKHGPRLYLAAGPALIGVGALLFAKIQTQNEIWSWGIAGVVFFAFGLAMLVAPITSVALKAVAPEFSGIASGVNTTMSRIGGLIAVSIAGVVITDVFNHPGATPLALHQTNSILHHSSVNAFGMAMVIVAVLAFASALVGFGITREPKHS